MRVLNLSTLVKGVQNAKLNVRIYYESREERKIKSKIHYQGSPKKGTTTFEKRIASLQRTLWLVPMCHIEVLLTK